MDTVRKRIDEFRVHLNWLIDFVRNSYQNDVKAVGDAYFDLRFYCIVQASLFGCLLLSGALASVSSRPWRVFAILGLGSLMHLLLDATQAKWASAVHLLAPISWRSLRLDHAKSLIVDSDKSITVIAYETGFADSAHFCRAFARSFGRTPHQYRLMSAA